MIRLFEDAIFGSIDRRLPSSVKRKNFIVNIARFGPLPVIFLMAILGLINAWTLSPFVVWGLYWDLFRRFRFACPKCGRSVFEAPGRSMPGSRPLLESPGQAMLGSGAFNGQGFQVFSIPDNCRFCWAPIP